MSSKAADRGSTSPKSQGGPSLVPCLMIRGGHVVLPGSTQPEIARDPEGRPYELFDVLDSLAARYGQLYVVDLDGVEREDPQLDYLQEIARDVEVWVDAGVRNADQAIDALVTGATRAILSSTVLEGPTELEKAWRLSQNLAFEVSIRSGQAETSKAAWPTRDPLGLAELARALGLRDVVLSFRDDPVDWELARKVALHGPTWIAGTFDARDHSRLAETGAAGGIFHLSGNLLTTPEGSRWSSLSIPLPERRDDET
ncbi:MAG: HisA/HisF-related TIM barrel protein [Thermoplasmata archaeon]|nr:HisA/HisF-related TIM barrel protein [Thermoplasmata archaeon]